MFTSLYATGTRTVRGLEALALVGAADAGRIDRQAARTTRACFRSAPCSTRRATTSQFLYGGYGYFDNMNAFFAANGYRVARPRGHSAREVHHANVWGVADEDLFTLALDELDATLRAGKPFFAHVMTTRTIGRTRSRPGASTCRRASGAQRGRNTPTGRSAISSAVRARKPWFKDTVFVITADHCASSAGSAALPVFRYHIPMWVYAPKHIAPARVTERMSQIDIAPTLLGLLGMDYDSQFYGVDVFQRRPAQAALPGHVPVAGLPARRSPRAALAASQGGHGEAVVRARAGAADRAGGSARDAGGDQLLRDRGLSVFARHDAHGAMTPMPAWLDEIAELLCIVLGLYAALGLASRLRPAWSKAFMARRVFWLLLLVSGVVLAQVSEEAIGGGSKAFDSRCCCACIALRPRGSSRRSARSR